MPEAPSRRDPLSVAATASTRRRVLLVDDHPDVRAMLSLALAEAGVGDVLTARDGQEALELIERDLQQVTQDGRRPMVDLIVLDIMMPGLSGTDVLRTLRARFTELPPVLIISALDSPAHIQEVIELGAAEFLSKPIEIEVFRQRARALIGAPNPRSLQGASLRGHDVPIVGRTEGAQPPRTDRRAARRDTFWIG
ncbi:MAG: response regulator [Deltaproteobacteria bacterium]|nr:MAG: response regulator [Deltaproteobacteria bacterium]